MKRSPSPLPTVSQLLTVLLAASLLGATATAQTLPISYQVQLQVRADTGGTAFNLPNGSTFNSVTASVNDLGKVAVKVSTVGLTTSPGVWFGGQGTGALVYNANDNDAILSDTYVNCSNQVSFPRFVSTSPADDGLYVYDNTTGMTTRVTNGPLGATSYTNPQINDNGIIGLRIEIQHPAGALQLQRRGQFLHQLRHRNLRRSGEPLLVSLRARLQQQQSDRRGSEHQRAGRDL